MRNTLILIIISFGLLFVYMKKSFWTLKDAIKTESYNSKIENNEEKITTKKIPSTARDSAVVQYAQIVAESK